MGATAHIKRIRRSTLDRFRAEPHLVEPFVMLIPMRAHPGASAEVATVYASAGLDDESRDDYVEELRGLDAPHAEALFEDASGEPIALDKFFDELRVLMEVDPDDTSSPLGRAIVGGAPIGPNLGYDRAHYLDAVEVAETAAALNAIDESRLDVSAAAARLPTGLIALLRTMFVAMRDYYRAAASDGDAMLHYLM